MRSLTTIRRESGQGLVEYALILPVLMLLLLGIMEGGLLMMRYNTVANAAREGARTGIVPPNDSCDLACLDARALNAASALTVGLDPAALTISLTRPPNSVRIEVTYVSTFITQPIITAFGATGTIQLRAVAAMRRE